MGGVETYIGKMSQYLADGRYLCTHASSSQLLRENKINLKKKIKTHIKIILIKLIPVIKKILGTLSN